ncbi:hypothetical protein [Flavisolibacter ginsenosidimutans]|uniref:Coproporphyrinogen III oxidase n=1 Tax=Flavisolibacter ginsenosidimutans TaxID=661481 RepID=A0A5B8UE66_9BACT|nr:hypothetical protein [Flavisolibacter ginsenosidimutans]QEC54793.1 hypothetical protein FSB75_02380 [Flavisolibacter ginsenosidimutans]
MQKRSFKRLCVSAFAVLFAAGMLVSCNNSSDKTTTTDSTTVRMSDTTHMNNGSKMMDTMTHAGDTLHKGEQTPPPSN